MKYVILLVAAVGVVLSALAGDPMKVEARQAGCLASPDTVALYHLEKLQIVVTAMDSSSIRVREGFGLPVIPASQVVWVQTDSVCAAAAATYRVVRQEPPPYAPVLVFELDTLYYAAVDPDARLGGWGHLVLMTRDFVYRHSVLW